MKIVAAMFLLALPAAGAEPPLPKLRVEPMTGGSIFYVRNVSTQPLTAFEIELVDYPGSFYALYEDEITSEPILPDKEKRIQVSNMTVGAVPDYVKIQAAIYADGSTAGVPERVSQLISRRQFTLDTVRDLIRRLQMMQEAKTPKDTAAANLRHAAEFMMLPPNVDKGAQISINQAAGRSLFGKAADYLDKHPVEEGLTLLRNWEKLLVESKPAS
jgi:hypothetical protein